jgi:thiol-disulfide isomerase/thioredoxin
MNKAIKTVFLLVFATLVGCDKVEGPYGSPIATNGGGDTTVQIIRKVLVEDFTGHTCGNCPRAAESLHQIEELYGNQIVSVAIHAGFFAAPSGTHYSSDYRTQVGNDLDQFFGNSAAGLPNGLVNRNMFGGTSAIIQHTDWASKASTLINLPPEAFMTISPNYTAASRLLTINVTTKILQNINESLSIVYYLTEDSIQSPQKDYSLPSPSSIDNYYHRHMLRGSMNGAWGNALGDGTTYSQNQEISTSSSFTIPAGWNPNKVSVVALIYRTASKESVQVEEKKIIN